MTKSIELCSLCGCATERAGRSDDSIYLDVIRTDPEREQIQAGYEVGPLCESCRDELERDGKVIQVGTTGHNVTYKRS